MSNLGRLRHGAVLLRPALGKGDVTLQLSGRRQSVARKLSRVVGITWIANPLNEPCVMFRDLSRRDDCSVANLFWGNTTDRMRQLRGKRVYQYRCDDARLEPLAQFDTVQQAAEALQCAASNISRVCTGSSKSYRGFFWSFDDLRAVEQNRTAGV